MPKRVTITLSDEQLSAIEDWRSLQRPIPNQNDAIVNFIQSEINLKKETDTYLEKVKKQ